ncbi:AraC family transcriptional regulator [Rhizobium anhuiense]|uniref:AraC family transcriptional regulator n=1 Tax=Rhizobium anhuiense TaxID=1184720 RepID=UPI0020CD4010|nr:AraC family transcriptional regulator [Rhizobium anhuiense]UTS88185.1 AraC family transcriptional regulator [Rhizobium anhuiense bv. trifolii]
MDALTDVVQLLRPKTVLMGSMVAYGDWGVQVPSQPGPMLYFIMEGSAQFRAGDGETTSLETGDFILSGNPTADIFFSRPDQEIVLSDEEFKALNTVDGEIRVGQVRSGTPTRIIGGCILCDPTNADLLSELLPTLVHVRAEEGIGARLGNLIAYIRDEAANSRAGSDLILSRLLEVLLIETLRREASTLPNPGMLRGLSDPQLARAISDIHSDVRRGWTIAELAQRAGMSRSAFARKFSAAVGLAPVEYLLRWRMAIAKDTLRHSRRSLEEVAEKVGYQSASAFSTAFSQRVGCPPSEFARMAGAT